MLISGGLERKEQNKLSLVTTFFRWNLILRGKKRYSPLFSSFLSYVLYKGN